MKILNAIAFILLCLLMIPVVSAQPPNQANKNRVDQSEGGSAREAANQATKAAQVFEEIMNVPEKGIPQTIVDNAVCIAVFPSVIKAGFIVGGRGGRGLVSCRRGNTKEWGPPIFLKIAGGSFGLQIGAQAVDLILVTMNQRAPELFTKGRFELGGEAAASAGPVGRNAAAESDLPTLRSQILSYSRSRGLFAGLELKGSVISRDDKLDEAIYGPNKTPEQILTDSVKVPGSLQQFTRTLAKYSTPGGQQNHRDHRDNQHKTK